MSNRKLLLADDSITIQKVVNLTFADEGIDVIAVGDGNSAMDKLREDMPDLIMADVNMPGLNGYEICEKIKLSDSKHSATPVILLVGSFEPFDEDEANRVGADGYLTKPFQSISQLVEKVMQLLNVNESENLEDTAEMFLDETVNTSNKNDNLPIPDDENSNIKRLANNFEDDEMIQTAQIGSIPIDDSVKYESTSEIPEFDSENQFSEPLIQVEEPDFNKTQPLTESDYLELSIDEANNATNIESKSEFTAESENQIGFDVGRAETSETPQQEIQTHDFESIDEDVKTPDPTPVEEGYQNPRVGMSDTSENTVEVQNNFEDNGSDLPMPEAASILELDEFNLLDLPPLDVFDEEPKVKNIPEPPTTSAEPTSSAEKVEETEKKVEEPVIDTITASEFGEIADEIDEEVSPETVKVIAEKIVERISKKEVREIAWEVVPELAELIIKKMAKEKIKD